MHQAMISVAAGKILLTKTNWFFHEKIHGFRPAVDRQPWSPRGMTRREGSASLTTVRVFVSVLVSAWSWPDT